jgi:hypothetical protein
MVGSAFLFARLAPRLKGLLARDVAKNYFHFLTPVQPRYLNPMQQIIINGMTASDFSELLPRIIREELQAIQQKLETESRKDLMSINEFCSEYGLSKSVVYART